MRNFGEVEATFGTFESFFKPVDPPLNANEVLLN
jgi:hypothetical protein